MSERLRWSSFDRVVVTRGLAKLTATDLEALANVLTSVGARVGKRLLLVQVGTMSGGISVHHVGRDAQSSFARYAAALRAHVEEVHALAPIGGLAGGLLRGIVSTVTKLGSNPSILHANLDVLVEALRRRHGVDPAQLRDCVARL